MSQYYMTQVELESYLSRAITLSSLISFNKPMEANIYPLYTDTLRMIANLQPKFIGRAALLWSNPSNDADHFARASQTAIDVHLIDSTIILQAGIFEYIHWNVTASKTAIEIPSWVYLAFGLPIPSSTEYFEFEDIVFDNWTHPNYQMYQGAVPDLNKPQAKMWFYYRAVKYIDAGFEALHLGHISRMNANDPLNIQLWDLVSKIRQYAASSARRHFVLIDAHTPGELYNNSNKLVFDFHSAPIKMKETSDTKGNKGCTFHMGYGLYGTNISRVSLGGECFMGWTTASLPYLIEFDNYGITNVPGQLTDDNHPQSWYNWGYDEITWFALQSTKFKKYWLQFAYFQLQYLSDIGHLQMPGIRVIRPDASDPWPWPNYFSNNPSAILPDPDTDNDGFPNLNHASSNNGYGMEDTIKDIWNGDTTFLKLIPLVTGNTGNYQIIETAINSSGNHIFCLGDDNRLYAYWKESGQPWRHNQLSNNVSNVEGSLIVSDSGQIYYRGTDKQVHRFYYNQGWQNEPLANNAPTNVDGKIFLSNKGNNIFYKGTDNRMYNYWKSGGVWKVAVLDHHINNVEGNIKIHSDDKIFYKGTDKRIHYFVYDNGWQNVALNPTASGNVDGNFVIANHGKNVFYKGTDNSMYNYWKNGKFWETNLLTSNNNVIFYLQDIQIDQFNKIYSRSNDNRIHLYFYDQGWRILSLDPTPLGIDSTLHVSSNADFVFYRNADQALDHVWFDGDNWINHTKWENTIEIKNIPFLEKGNQLYVVSKDNKVYSMTFGQKY